MRLKKILKATTTFTLFLTIELFFSNQRGHRLRLIDASFQCTIISLETGEVVVSLDERFSSCSTKKSWTYYLSQNVNESHQGRLSGAK